MGEELKELRGTLYPGGPRVVPIASTQVVLNVSLKSGELQITQKLYKCSFLDESKGGRQSKRVHVRDKDRDTTETWPVGSFSHTPLPTDALTPSFIYCLQMIAFLFTEPLFFSFPSSLP